MFHAKMLHAKPVKIPLNHWEPQVKLLNFYALLIRAVVLRLLGNIDRGFCESV